MSERYVIYGALRVVSPVMMPLMAEVWCVCRGRAHGRGLCLFVKFCERGVLGRTPTSPILLSLNSLSLTLI